MQRNPPTSAKAPEMDDESLLLEELLCDTVEDQQQKLIQELNQQASIGFDNHVSQGDSDQEECLEPPEITSQ